MTESPKNKNTVVEERTTAKARIDHWTAEIAKGKISILGLNVIAESDGILFALEELTMCFAHERRHRANMWLKEAQRKVSEPGAGVLYYRAQINVFTRFLSGQLTLD